MTVFIIVAGSILLVTIITLVIFYIRLLIQVRRSAQSLEKLLENVNDEVTRVGDITDSASKIAGVVSGSLGKGGSFFAGLAAQLIKHFVMNGKEKKKPAASKGSFED